MAQEEHSRSSLENFAREKLNRQKIELDSRNKSAAWVLNLNCLEHALQSWLVFLEFLVEFDESLSLEPFISLYSFSFPV